MPGAAFEAFTQLATGWINGFARAAETTPLPYAFVVGMLAALNPCGFVMLPGFAAFYVTTDGAPGRDSTAARLGRALRMAMLTTVAFLALFVLVGLLVTAGGQAVMRATTWAGAAVGVLLVGVGGYQLATRRSLVARFTPSAGTGYSRSARGALAYGFAYATCSLGCTLPTFLIVAGSVLAGNRDLAEAGSRFVQYALGMGAMLGAVAVSVALVREGVARSLRRLMPLVEPAANALLVLIGLYVLWYWTDVGAA